MASVLETADLKGIAQYIKSGKCKNISLMLGAGISTAAGIPDFRSEETGTSPVRRTFVNVYSLTNESRPSGLYANLARLNLPYPEAVFEINFFQNNPTPFYTLAHELYPGKFRPTLTHAFIRLLSERSLLRMCFTQNIDTLERRAGVPANKIIEAHGSFATQRCIKCKTPFDDTKMKEMVSRFSEDKVVPKCEKKGCKGLVKPDIVFFGEALPSAFGQAPRIIKTDTDLLIVIGTSLTVHPFASLAYICPDNVPRVLINIELVGDFGSGDEDVILLGKCDEVIQELCEELGWEEELLKLWEETAKSTDAGAATAATESKAKAMTVQEGSKPVQDKEVTFEGANNNLEDEVAKLAEKIQKQMDLQRASVEPEEYVPPLPSSDNTPTVGPPSAGYAKSKPETSSSVVATESEATVEIKAGAEAQKQEPGSKESQKL
ncbi:hypothetical protein D9757_007457 [Collybiopsis confluens]|uniref:NAD-dependent protein deacetylase n=1 Tax=Collybiopsis confluens TaxID=2823264 RepID=A0A8H5HJQ1_9AGAR|nr:hypothetical protein D9757_007457 [Collybiopsis confluens]